MFSMERFRSSKPTFLFFLQAEYQVGSANSVAEIPLATNLSACLNKLFITTKFLNAK